MLPMIISIITENSKFFEDNAKEPLLKPFRTYTVLNNFYPTLIIHHRFQVDHVNSIQFFCLVTEEMLILFILMLERLLY